MILASDRDPSELETVRATLRIDSEPGAKRFQGVWLEREGERWVIDYRARELWRGFDGSAVIAVGERYEPLGQAVNAQHFRVHSLRFDGPCARAVPLRAIGAEKMRWGRFEHDVFALGSKLAGSELKRFTEDSGQRFALAGSSASGELPEGHVVIVAREVEVDPTYAATVGGPHLWVLSARPADEGDE